MKSSVVILHSIRSAQNVGSIFRTAEAAGVQSIVLTGYTPTPIDRFGRKRGDLAKAALGAEETVSWEHKESIVDTLEEYNKKGVETIAVEQHKNSIDYRTLKPGIPRVYVFGNEVEGLPKEVLRTCTHIAEIPLYGKKESLNVAVAAGIVLFRAIPRVPSNNQ